MTVPRNKKVIVLFVLLSLALLSCTRMKSAVYYSEGGRAHNRGDFEAAIELYKKSIDADPGKPEIQYDLGVAYLDNHNFAKATQQIKRLREMGEPEMADVLEGLWYKQKSL